jgi:DNA-binding transcriptional ArsR family regulator
MGNAPPESDSKPEEMGLTAVFFFVVASTSCGEEKLLLNCQVVVSRSNMVEIFFLHMQPYGCIFSPVDAVFKALADESRRKLLDRLHSSNGQTLTELCRNLDMSRQAITKHLGLLEAANLITVVWHGREKLHYLNPVPLHEIYERWISKYERHRLQALSDLKKGLEQHKKEQ